MTPKEQKVLTQALTANRRALSLLDRRMDDLLKVHPVLLADYDVEDRQPFFYGTIGSDGQLGMSVTAANVGENPSFGYVRMHTDSAFVLTRVSAGLTINNAAGTSTSTAFGIGLRMYDESSSRWITFTNRNGEPQQKAVFPVEAFSAFDAYNEGGFDLPAECVFPRSAVVRVEAYLVDQTADLLFSTERLQVVFNGYKVFGG